MYTDGKFIIEKKNFTISVVTAHAEVIYTLKSEKEAYKMFITLILEREREKN